MAVKYLDNAGTQYLVNKIKAIDGKIPTESQITTMITSALNTYKEGIVTIVESLPQTGEEGKLYLVLDPSDSDVYIIYTWEENAFKRMGSKTFTLTVDSALSATSTNPVQNKVVKSALDGKANSSHTHGSITNDGKLGTASRVVITGTDKKIGISTVTTTELGYLSGVTSAIQTQLNGKSATGHTHTAGDVAGLATVATTGSYNDLSNKPSIPIKISDLQDDVDMLTSHEDLHLENLPNESPNIRFINNSPQITWNDYVYHDPSTTLISGPSYEFDDESSLTSKSKIGYTNSSNSQNTVEHIYGQTYGTTKSFFTMKYYYGSNEKNAEEDESCTINSSLVFTLDPNYYSAGADTYYDESNAYSDVSPNNENYFLGGYRPFKEIHAKDFMIVRNGYGFSLSSGFDDIYTHTEDTDIHVTASDKTTWNAVTSKANDSDVVHKSGNETVGGIKNFTDYTYIRALNFTNEVASPSSSDSAIMPIVTTVTYTDQSPSQSARLNFRITANGDKSLYPHENNQYSLGLTSRRWSDFFSYHGNFAGQQQGDEYSGNARTNLTLLANRDSVGQSGCVVDTFRENTTQGTGMHILGFGMKENSIRYEGVRFQWGYDSVNSGYDFNLKPSTQGTNKPLTYNLGTSTDKWSTINGLEPSSLGMPDLSNGIDISSYITHLDKVVNQYTPPVNGYINIRVKKTSLPIVSIRIQQNYGLITSCETADFSTWGTYLPVVAGTTVEIYISADSLTSAIFFPCQGNV